MFDFTVYSVDEVHEANMDFSEYLQEKVLKLTLANLPCTEERVRQVEEVTENFYAHFGQHLNTVCLYYLSNYLLQDFIKNPSYNKTAKQENGFLSPRQLAYRNSQEISYPVAVIDVCRTNSLFNIARPKWTVNIDDV